MSNTHKLIFALTIIFIILLFVFDKLEVARATEKNKDKKLTAVKTDTDNKKEESQTITLQEVKGDDADKSPESVSEEAKNATLDCENSTEIAKDVRGENKMCRNIYKTDENQIKDEVKKENPERLVLYGQHVIYDCPATSGKVDNVNGECYQIAKFMDSYQYEKMLKLFDVSALEKRLFVYLADTQPKLAKLCHADAVACFDGDSHIFIPTGEKGTKELYLKEGEESVYGFGTKKTDMLYNYQALAPADCPTPSLLFHELTHYFNHLGMGRMSSWVDESVARMAVDPLVKAVCAPGIKYENVTKRGEGKIDDFKFNDDDQVSSMISDFWQGSESKRDYLLGINDKIKEQGLSYFHKLYYTMGNGGAGSHAG